ncbi:major facilitator superfamily domain-containing protein [Astrocystis sublimbata]|nr:major facilitator superfamily domain-containing protein [Astrocystis sublimbata]
MNTTTEPKEAISDNGRTETTAPNGVSVEEEDAEYTIFTPTTRKFLIVFLGITMTLSTLTATIYFPLIPMLSTQLRVSIQEINLTVTVYVIFQAVTPAFFASLSDSFGRRPVILGIIFIYAAATLGLVVNPYDYAVLITLRGLQSIGGSATTALAYGVVADVAVTSQRGKMLGPMLAICNGISAVGPVVGGAVALGTSAVTGVFAALLGVALLCLGTAGFALPETARCVVGNGSRGAKGVHRTWWDLLRRNFWHKHRKSDVEDSERDGHRVETETETRRRWSIASPLAAFRIIFIPEATAVLWMIGTSYTVYYTFQVAIPVIFAQVYHYNELQIGLSLLASLAGLTIGGIVAGKLLDRNYAHVARANDIDINHKKAQDLYDFPVEEARYRNIAPFFILQVVLIVGYGWGVTYEVHPAVPLILQFFICAVSTLLSHTASALLVDIFPAQSSTSYAAAQAVRCGLSAVASATLQPLINVLGRGWYFTAFALFVNVNGLLAVGVSRRWGMGWRRARSTVSASVEEGSSSGAVH